MCTCSCGRILRIRVLCTMCVFPSRTTIVLFWLRAIKSSIHESRLLENSKWIAFPMKQSQLHTSLSLSSFSEKKKKGIKVCAPKVSKQEAEHGQRRQIFEIKKFDKSGELPFSLDHGLSLFLVSLLVYHYSSYVITLEYPLPISLPNLLRRSKKNMGRNRKTVSSAISSIYHLRIILGYCLSIITATSPNQLPPLIGKSSSLLLNFVVSSPKYVQRTPRTNESTVRSRLNLA